MTLTERYEVLMALLLKEIEITAIQNEFQSKVKERVDKNQKEYILREQMKLIRGGTRRGQYGIGCGRVPESTGCAGCRPGSEKPHQEGD